MANNGNNINNDKSLESWIWDAAYSIHGVKDTKAVDTLFKVILSQFEVGA